MMGCAIWGRGCFTDAIVEGRLKLLKAVVSFRTLKAVSEVSSLRSTGVFQGQAKYLQQLLRVR